MHSFKEQLALCAAVCFFVLAHPAPSQTRPSGAQEGGTVLSVDSRRIGTEEFETRLNMFSVGLPQDPYQRKQAVALSLIQEEVLAQAARAAHLDTASQVKAVTAQYEKEAAYEAWMDREVRSKVTMTDAEVSRAYDLYRQMRIVDYRTYRDSLSARRAESRFRRVLTGKEAPKDTLTQSKELAYGEAQKRIEDAVFSMKPGETRIMPVDGKWYIFGLRSVVPHPTRANEGFSQAYPKVERLVHKEKELQILDKKMSALMAGRSFTLAPQAREHLFRLLSERIPFSNPQITKFPELVNQEIARRLPPAADMKETFLTFKDGSKLTLGQLWNLISIGPYLLNYRSPDDLRGGLDYIIRRVVVVETVTKAAYKTGLDKTPYVEREKAMWTDNLLSNLFQYRLSQSRMPTAAELSAEAETFKGPAAEVRERVLQKKTHAAIDSVMDREIARHTIVVDTSALYGTHALEGDVVVRKEHFPNRFAAPRLTPANPEAAWARKLMHAWGDH